MDYHINDINIPLMISDLKRMTSKIRNALHICIAVVFDQLEISVNDVQALYVTIGTRYDF